MRDSPLPCGSQCSSHNAFSCEAVRRRTSNAPGGLESQRAADQPEVAVGLRVVAEATLGERVVLLRQEPRRPRGLEHLLEELLRVAAPAGAQVGLHEPGRADVEPTLEPGQPVVPAIAIDDSAASQLRLHLQHRREKARIVVGDEPREARPRGRRRRCPRRRRQRSTRRPHRSIRAGARWHECGHAIPPTRTGRARREAPAPRSPWRP